MEKVIISKSVKEALDYLLQSNQPFEIVKDHTKDVLWSLPETEVLNELALDELIRALYVGYEVKYTPEEMLANACIDAKKSMFVHRSKGNRFDAAYYDGMYYGIKKAADVMGLKIKEINI